MTDINDIKKLVNSKFKDEVTEYKAVMGRADGVVKSEEPYADENDVYVTLYNGNVVTAHNTQLPLYPLRKIIVGFNKEYPNLYRVLRFDDVYNVKPEAHIPNHKKSHAWFSSDPIDVYAEQFYPRLPRAAGGLTVRVYGGEYYCNNKYHIMPTINIDLTSEIPADGAEWVNVEIDELRNITFNHSVNYANKALLEREYIPATNSDKLLLCSVMLQAGQAEIMQNKTQSDIFDPRFTSKVALNNLNPSLYHYKAKTTIINGSPSDGFLIWDNTTQITSATINLSHMTSDDNDIDLFFSFFAADDKIVVQDMDDSSNYQIWIISSTPTIHANDYIEIPVTLDSSGGTGSTNFSNNHRLIVSRFGSGGGGSISDGDKGDIIVSGSGSVLTIDDNVVNFDKMTNASSQYKIIGRSSSGGGNWEEISSSGDVFNILQQTSYAGVKGLLGTHIDNRLCSGRLTLQSNNPSPTSDVTAATTLYFTPYLGNYVSVYVGGQWVMKTFSEISLSLSGFTASKNSDIFIYDNSGTLALERTEWTGDTNRGTSLALQDGVLIKNGNATRRYVGTIRTSATGQCESSLTKRFVWNYYNRVTKRLSVTDTTSHTYTSASIRYWNNNTANKIEFVVGLQEDDIFFSILNQMTGAATSSFSQGCIGLGINTTSVLTAVSYWASAFNMRSASNGVTGSGLGYNYIAICERGLTGVTFQIGQANLLLSC